MDTHTAATYIRHNFNRDDHIAIVMIRKSTGSVEQRIEPAGKIASDPYQRWLRHMNATRHEVYVSMNTMHPGSTGRTKRDVSAVRHVFLDFDHNGDEALRVLAARKDIPVPNHIIESSPGRYQTIWRVDGFTPTQAEHLMIGMGRELGGDPAVHDIARVMRLPGFYNHKYEKPHFVTARTLHDKVVSPANFPEFAHVPERTYSTGSARQSAGKLSQSERDWAETKRALFKGTDPAEVERVLAAKRADKPDPEYYAKLTVAKARKSLQSQGMSI